MRHGGCQGSARRREGGFQRERGHRRALPRGEVHMKTAMKAGWLTLGLLGLGLMACGGGDEGTQSEEQDIFDASGPGRGASDARVPELGADLSVVRSSKISMQQALAQV